MQEQFGIRKEGPGLYVRVSMSNPPGNNAIDNNRKLLLCKDDICTILGDVHS
jgi:hypothetical protein